jgi:signal transduction histidine kinase
VLATAVERAADLVRRTLDYAREGPPPLAFTPVALAPLASEVAGLVSQQGYSVRLINEIAPDLVVSAERLQLFRVLSNLMRNAAEAGAKNLRISACRDGHNALIDIADDGPGLPDTIRRDLFRPFAGSRRRGGAGLGLAIVRDLMVAHGGDIILLTTGETGTTFRLTLRLADTDQSGKDGTRGERVAPATSADV